MPEHPPTASAVERQPVSLEQSYDEFPRIEEDFQLFLDQSLDPRGPSSLFDLVASLGLRSGARAVDVGCGEGDDSLELTRRFGLVVTGVDPVLRHIELATGTAATSVDLPTKPRFELGTAERLPVNDQAVEFLWCKEVLMFADLPAAFAEFTRVLTPAGIGFVYQVLTGPEMDDVDAASFWSCTGDANSVRPADVESAMFGAGLRLRERVDLTSEWGEFGQERSGAAGRRLLHVARLKRDPGRYIARYGEANYRIMLSDCLWHVYRMLGKLTGAVFIFDKSA